MRQEFIQCATRAEAIEIAPWAAIIIKVDGGYRAFECVEDARRWKKQK